MQTLTLCSGITANGTVIGPGIDTGNVPARPDRVYQGTVTGTGIVTATISLFGSNDGITFGSAAFGTITLSGTTLNGDVFPSAAAYQYVQMVVSNVTGTGATVRVTVAL